jgi:hypothetical protein
MEKNKKDVKAVKVQIKKKFLSPLTNRLTKIDEVISVPENQFWFKRLKNGDCIKVKNDKKQKFGKEKKGNKA